MEEGTIVEWRVKEGQRFEEGDVIVEISSDKATSEVEATFSGTMVEILVMADESVAVAEKIAIAQEDK